MSDEQLKRQVGVFGAVFIGLGSILGTGVFVSIGLGAGIAGPALLISIVIAALVATCNGLSSAQLAAAHPVSGGSYEYGYEFLNHWVGFTAGWTFLAAKSASAATAALGVTGYLLGSFDVFDRTIATFSAPAAVALITILTLTGIRRTNIVNIVIVSITLVALAVFAVGMAGPAVDGAARHLWPMFGGGVDVDWRDLLHAAALMFVAYTGYGRIATLSEEVVEPRRNIPRAVIITLAVSMLLYLVVALAGVAAGGSELMAEGAETRASTLGFVAERLDRPVVAGVVAVGAVTAMLGVLLNLVLGLSRVVLAMGRRGDAPKLFARLDAARTTPVAAVILVGLVIAGLSLIGSVELTWTFSAMTVLIYYAITNAACLALPAEQRLYSRVFAWCGLIGCLGLAAFIPWQMWLVGLAVLAAGWVWHAVARWVSNRSKPRQNRRR